MRRLVLFILLVSMVVCGSCSKGGDGGYDFTGNWIINERVNDSNVGNIGATWSEEFRIDTNGSEIVMRLIRLNWVYRGTCDAKAKTFTVVLYDGPVTDRYEGHAESNNMMSGTSRIQAGLNYFTTVWTATLIGRNKSIGDGRGIKDGVDIEDLVNILKNQ